jgi:hypothetical protein
MLWAEGLRLVNPTGGADTPTHTLSQCQVGNLKQSMRVEDCGSLDRADGLGPKSW